jgi:hypothetical protein
MYSFFGQDSWKVSRKLTLDLGLRYDFATPAYELNNRLVNFDPAAALAAQNPAQALASLKLGSSGSLENRALIKPDRKFCPSLRFCLLTRETSARGGYGICTAYSTEWDRRPDRVESAVCQL